MSAPAPRPRRPRRHLITAGALVVAGGALAGPATGGPALAPLLAKSGPAVIPDQYIVVLKPGATTTTLASAQAVALGGGSKLGFTYASALQGFSLTASPAQIDRLRALPEVAYVEPDTLVTIDTIQPSPPRGLDRTSERYLPLDTQFTYSSDGTGVHAYVIDTGIRPTHVELSPRVSAVGFTAIMDGNGMDDCNGHGTHVAGTIGGLTYGMAKNVTVHPVRVIGCGNSGPSSGVLAGVNWVIANATSGPRVVNMSLGGPASTSLDAAVNTGIAAGITFVVAAGNAQPMMAPVDACTVSPARVPDAITVGSVNPINDNYSAFSNFGSCLDLFGPGEGIRSAFWSSDTATAIFNGTSQASPHVAGAAALYLQTHPAALPATVRAAIMNAANTAAFMPAWGGVIGLPAGSPNVELHWGSLNDGHDDGDPHIVTVGGIPYDFQSAGEFTLLADGKRMEIQTRQTAVETNHNGITNAYTGLTSCVSLNTAFAARVGDHRVSFVPNVNGEPDPSGLQLRIDGTLTTLPASGANLGPGGHISSYGPGGIQVDFPDGTTAIVVPNWWPTESRWYLNISFFHTPASEGIAGALAAGSWLPGLPGGGSMGPMPADLHQRYLDLNTKFADAWRVTDETSLFDYAPGESTATFTFRSWPPEKAPCILGNGQDKPVEPLDRETAVKVCEIVRDKGRNLDCVGDVMATGETGFAKAHQISEAIAVGSTRTLVDDPQPQTKPGAAAQFTITVGRNAFSNAAVVPTGTVQLFIDDKLASAALRLDRNGQALAKLDGLEAGVHEVTAAFTPAKGSVYLTSVSVPIRHVVR